MVVYNENLRAGRGGEKCLRVVGCRQKRVVSAEREIEPMGKIREIGGEGDIDLIVFKSRDFAKQAAAADVRAAEPLRDRLDYIAGQINLIKGMIQRVRRVDALSRDALGRRQPVVKEPAQGLDLALGAHPEKPGVERDKDDEKQDVQQQGLPKKEPELLVKSGDAGAGHDHGCGKSSIVKRSIRVIAPWSNSYTW